MNRSIFRYSGHVSNKRLNHRAIRESGRRLPGPWAKQKPSHVRLIETIITEVGTRLVEKLYPNIVS